MRGWRETSLKEMRREQECDNRKFAHWRSPNLTQAFWSYAPWQDTQDRIEASLRQIEYLETFASAHINLLFPFVMNQPIVSIGAGAVSCRKSAPSPDCFRRSALAGQHGPSSGPPLASQGTRARLCCQTAGSSRRSVLPRLPLAGLCFSNQGSQRTERSGHSARIRGRS
jgi:hypothetical protein